MGYSTAALAEAERHELEEIEPDVVPIGAVLRTSEMRPSVWQYEAGESSNRHYQAEQEELYVPLSGRYEVELVEQGEDAEPETVEIGPEEFLVVDPETVREVTAIAAGSLLVVGAPNTKDDGVVVA